MKSPKPGSSDFGERLLARLRTSLGADVAIEAMRVSSRNTIIYRLRSGAARLVCKADFGSRQTMVEDEYRMLQEMRRRFEGTGVRSLVPVAVYPELNALVTREEPGEPVREHIDRALRSAPGSEARRFAEGLMEPCAEALFRFHAAFGLQREGPRRERAMSYIDFDPRNLLVLEGEPPTLVMMDPPTEPLHRRVHFDVGSFCFGLARAGFAPGALSRAPQAWLDAVKAKFIAAYFRRLGRCAGARDLARIKAVERHRAGRALLRYAQFLRYRNWPRELARMMYFSPIIGAYVLFHLGASYRRLARSEPILVALEAGKRG